MRENSGASLKSALRHILSIDLRDELIFPTCGSLFQLTTEFAGLGGDVGFIKNDFYVQGNYSVVEDFVLQGTLSGGILRGISNDMKIGLCDMFYLGGPLSLRGFQMRGVGPHADGDAIGSHVSFFLSLEKCELSELSKIKIEFRILQNLKSLNELHFFSSAFGRPDCISSLPCLSDREKVASENSSERICL